MGKLLQITIDSDVCDAFLKFCDDNLLEKSKVVEKIIENYLDVKEIETEQIKLHTAQISEIKTEMKTYRLDLNAIRKQLYRKTYES